MNKKGSTVYLVLVYGVCFGLGIIALLTQKNGSNPAYEFLQKGFTAIPVLAALAARLITKDKSPWNISLCVWKKPGLWTFSALVPSTLIALAAILYFLLFPGNYSGVFNYGELAQLTGISNGGAIQVDTPLAFWFICILAAAVCIPIQLLELGEEIGWRGYLLPRQIEKYGVHRAVLLNSFLWGVVHLPLIYFGFNYSPQNPGAPWSNMALMVLVCMATGIICSYVTIVSGNCMYAAIVHGAINVIGEVPVFLSVQQENGLFGPNPTGLIGMAGLILCAIVLFARLGKVENYWSRKNTKPSL